MVCNISAAVLNVLGNCLLVLDGEPAVHPDQAVAKIGMSGCGFVVVRGVGSVITFYWQVPAKVGAMFAGLPFLLPS